MPSLAKSYDSTSNFIARAKLFGDLPMVLASCYYLESGSSIETAREGPESCSFFLNNGQEAPKIFNNHVTPKFLCCVQSFVEVSRAW